jgi:spermidine/putrescine-binding protein
MKRILFVIVSWIILVPNLELSAQTSNSYKEDLAQYKDAGSIYLTQVQGKEMSKEEEEKLLRNLSPEIRIMMEEIKKLNKNKYYQLLRSTFPFGNLITGYSNQEVLKSLLSSGENLKREKELEIEAELLALRIKKSDSITQPKLRNELAGVLNELFDIKETKKEAEIKQLEKRLKELKESIQARKQNKNEIVERRMQEMLGDSRYYRWE